MVIDLPQLRIGEPLRREALAVFPLFAESSPRVEYRLAGEAIADEQIVVAEISESGSVPDLQVENKGNARVLFIEGEELVGAKQNRVLNTSVLVAAHSSLKVPVSCVEQGRWRYKSRNFGSSGGHATSKLRRTLKASVASSLKAQQGYRSDQAEVWKGIAELHAVHSVKSGTGAMSDAFEAYQIQLAAYRENLKYVEGAVGLAVAIGPRVVSLDYFDQPATCRKMWERLLSGVVFEALEARATEGKATAAEVEALLAATAESAWASRAAVGDGEEYRAETRAGDHASALVVDGAIIHASVMTAG